MFLSAKIVVLRLLNGLVGALIATNGTAWLKQLYRLKLFPPKDEEWLPVNQ